MEVIVRSMEDEDRNFIISTFLKSYRIIAQDDLVNPVVSRIPGKTYFKGQEKIVKRLLESAKVLVACDKEDPSFIIGYLVFDEGRIHYAYTKGNFRKTGVARKLLKASGLDLTDHLEFSHHTPDVYWIRQKLPNLNYNPYFEEVTA